MLVSTAEIIVVMIGAIVGLVMGLTGAGGGILAVPALVYTQGWSMQQAMPVALLAVSCAAAIGAVEGLFRKLVRYRAAMLMAVAGSLPTMLGVQVAHRLSQQWLMLVFAGILCIVAVRLILQLRSPDCDDNSRAAVARINSNTGRFDWSFKTGAVIAGIGAVSGFMTGLLGVGGGFIIVPMLRHYTNASMHMAVATSLLVVSMVGSMGVGSALISGAHLPLALSALFVTTTVGGMLAARRIAARLPARQVQMIFVVALFCVAASLLFRAAA
ncbi:sulfite exporter TauE/SafE family protein [Undibacterium sp. TS12]|uniref:sulfite exporter TauE/SafE family protein n=1 Tax=Undibacterium sp. TS12 TaxID=2908202 RepID=UPI001F4C5A89|nr:sulfite exporter TauE/SafE family protein [Undibacterium sp. TS12]MCH8617750.1 sulfite exporter TauE/SafE family protein [Undibacterium sp. TS12]